MSYTFDASSGATLDRLTEMVLANSFSANRYTEFAHAWLNDAVEDVCHRLRLHRNMEILDYDAAGVVTQPAQPYYHVEELWLAYGSASGEGEQAVAQGAYYRLEPLPTKTPAGMRSTTPAFYTVRREAQTSRILSPAIRVVPAGVAGKVAIVGLQRPAIMDDGADVSGLGADLDRALVAYAKGQAFEAEDDFEMATRWSAIGVSPMSVYERTLRSALQVPMHSDGPVTTPGAWHEGLLSDGGR